MFDLHTFFYGVFPYIATVVFLLGSWIRFDHEQYTWKSDSSQLLSRANMRLGSNLFHAGILGIFLGHVAGMVLPHALWTGLGISDLAHQWIAILAGLVFGGAVVAGGAILWRRRMFNKRVRAASRWMDINILGWLIITAGFGLLTIPFSISHAVHGDVTTMLVLGEWIRSILTLQPNPELIRHVDFIYKVHVFFGMSVFLFFPFTRLVHVWSAPVPYLFRAYQVVRTKRSL